MLICTKIGNLSYSSWDILVRTIACKLKMDVSTKICFVSFSTARLVTASVWV